MHRFSRRFFASVTALFLMVMWVPAAILNPAHASNPVFEIDGNKTVDTAGNLDWTSPDVGTQPVENDDAGGDPTVYSSSSKESNDPSTWTLSGGAPPKDDMTNIYAYAQPGTANVFFGFDRGATSGTDSYYLELNKLQPTNTTTYAPNRSDGDRRFRLDDKGNGVIALSAESVWTSGAWVTTTLSSNPAGFDYAVSADESFLEFSFDLTTLLGLQPACPPLFGSLGFRNVTGATGENLKDFIKPVKLSAGSTCGLLKIVKHDGNGALLGGATFRITPDPRPVANPAAYLDVLDNGPYDNDPADGQVTVDPATPGDYTVTEQVAPAGYLLDSSSPTVHVPGSAANSPVPVFVDTFGSITVHKMNEGSQALGGSTFQLLDHATGAVVDTVADTDGDGTLVFTNVATGTYDLHESVAPPAYDAAADVTGVVVDQDHQDVSVDVHDSLTPFPVLALAKTADPASGSIVQRGDSIDYTISVTNSGTGAAHQVSVVDTLPANVTLDESSVSPTETDNSNGRLTWLVDVPPAQNGVDGVTTITYTVTVDATAPEGATLTNAVLIDGACPGAPVGSDPCTTDHHVPTGDLTLVKHVDKTAAGRGDTLTYTFDAATTGALDQTDVVVTDVVPTGTTYVGGSAGCSDAGPCTTGYDATTRTVSWALGDITHGAPARHLAFQVTIDRPSFDPTVGLPTATITNSGAIVSGETAQTPSNQVKTTVIQVLGIKVVRQLPFTGAGVPPVTAIAVASVLIVAGTTLMAARRREQ